MLVAWHELLATVGSACNKSNAAVPAKADNFTSFCGVNVVGKIFCDFNATGTKLTLLGVDIFKAIFVFNASGW